LKIFLHGKDVVKSYISVASKNKLRFEDLKISSYERDQSMARAATDQPVKTTQPKH
jgi:hypothetical protein